MKRLEYMMELRKYLSEGGLPDEELDDALRFYEEIFLDAGAEKEEETAQNLGSPKDLARQILIDNNINVDGNPEYFVAEKNNNHKNSQQNFSNTAEYHEQQNDNSSTLKKLLIIAVTFPIWLPIVCAVGGTAFGVIVSIIAIIFALIVTGVIFTIAGISIIFSVPPVGLTMFGIGLILTAINGLVVFPFIKWICKLAVKFFNWIVSVFRRIFGVRSVV